MDQVLNLPACDFRSRVNDQGNEEIFDPIRRKYVAKTPEERVRLHFIQFLIIEKHYPDRLISVEKGLTVNGMKRRFDAVVYNRKGEPLVLIEFKAPEVKIGQKVFDQMGAYNLALRVKYLMVSNGLRHFCCRFDTSKMRWEFLDTIPPYPEL